MIRLAIVDDDVFYRAGRVALLVPIEAIEVTASLDFESALAYGIGWDEVDVALVDAYDARSAGRRRESAARAGIVVPGVDRFAGVRVVEAIRERRPSRDTTVIVVSHYKSGNALLWKRMAEAGADFFYDHVDVGDPERLVEAIVRPSRERSVSASGPDLQPWGIGSGARLNAALDAVQREERVGPMLTDGVGHKAVSGVQHRTRQIRAQLASMLDMRAHWHRDSEQRLRSPPLSQLRPIVRNALGLDLPSENDTYPEPGRVAEEPQEGHDVPDRGPL